MNGPGVGVSCQGRSASFSRISAVPCQSAHVACRWRSYVSGHAGSCVRGLDTRGRKGRGQVTRVAPRATADARSAPGAPRKHRATWAFQGTVWRELGDRPCLPVRVPLRVARRSASCEYVHRRVRSWAQAGAQWHRLVSVTRCCSPTPLNEHAASQAECREFESHRALHSPRRSLRTVCRWMPQ